MQDETEFSVGDRVVVMDSVFSFNGSIGTIVDGPWDDEATRYISVVLDGSRERRRWQLLLSELVKVEDGTA